MKPETRTLSLKYDPGADVLTVAGVHYSGEFFRQAGRLEPGHVFEVVERRRGRLWIRDIERRAWL